MNGQDIVNAMYAIAQAVNNDLRKVQVFSDNGELYMNAIGVHSIHSYHKAIGKRGMEGLLKIVSWDEKFDRWRLVVPMSKGVPLNTGLNVEKHNKKKPVEEVIQLPISTLINNNKIKKEGDAMTENQVARQEYNHLKETGQLNNGKTTNRVRKYIAKNNLET